jgi:hypothetical protein
MIKERVRDLTNELGDSSLNIIEATAVPDRFHASCIAQSDGQLYTNFVNALETYEGCYPDNHWFPLI